MTSLQTFFRAVIMLATLAIVAKVWLLYGPSVDEMRKITTRVAEVSHELWQRYRQADTAAPAGAESLQPPAPTVVPPAAQLAAEPPQPVQLTAGESSDNGYAQPAVAEVPLTASATSIPPWAQAQSSTQTSPPPVAAEQAIMHQLKEMGVAEQRLERWGADGQLFRFSCDAPWLDAPNYTRHFESVAADPATAVQQVAAEVRAWHAGQAMTARPY